MKPQHQWHVYDSAQAASQSCAEFMSHQIQECLAQNEHCSIALPGGKTPADCLQHISQQDIDWQRTHWLPGDERCLPIGDTERNDTLFHEHFLNLIPLPAENFHPMPAELGAEQGAEEFSQQLGSVLPLDIAFLGMGEDGHTASLFPDNPALTVDTPAVAVHNSPKPPPDRISLSIASLQQAGLRCVLTLGASKRDALTQIQQGKLLPINTIGPVHWFVDRAAMAD